MKFKDIKTEVIEYLKDKGYSEIQLNQLNLIVENVINATIKALNNET